MVAKILLQLSIVAMLSVAGSCTGNRNENRSETNNTAEGREKAEEMESEKSKLKINSVYRIKRDGTYVDLQTGKKIAVRHDSVTNVMIDEATSFPVPFFIDLDTKDTIDQRGRIVNNALIPGENGTWRLDEGKLKKIE